MASNDDDEMDANVPAKKEDEDPQQREPERSETTQRSGTISPISESQELPCLFLILIDLMCLVSRPVTRLFSAGRRNVTGTPPSPMAQYNRPDHNIFIQMQQADPLAPESRKRKTPPKEIDETRERRMSDPKRRERQQETEAAAQLSNLAYHKIPKKE
jgi:hypothetical protein